VPVTHLITRRARIDVSLDGVTITRSASDAAKRGTARRVDVGWDALTGAAVERTRKGRPVVRIGVAGVCAPDHHRDDPYAVKAPRRQSEAAYRLVEQVEEEVAARRLWRERAEA
jgi:hypothetical protein